MHFVHRRLIALILSAWLCFSGIGCAEQEAILGALDLNEIQAYAEEAGFDFMEWIQSLLEGDLDFAKMLSGQLSKIGDYAAAEFEAMLQAIALPAAGLAMLKFLLPKGSSMQKTAALMCRIACACALMDIYRGLYAQAENLLEQLVRTSNAMTPTLIAAVSLAGAESASASLSPMAALCSSAIQEIFQKWGLALSSADVCIAVAGNLSAEIPLKKLHKLLAQILHWGTGGMLAAFTAMLSLQGKLASGRDSAMTRSARYAVETLIPVIGGNVSDSLDSLLSAAYIVKNALGISGCLLIASIALIPIAHLLLCSVLLKLTAAIAEPLGDDALTHLAGNFADSVEMLLILTLASALLCALLLGSCLNAASNVVR